MLMRGSILFVCALIGLFGHGWCREEQGTYAVASSDSKSAQVTVNFVQAFTNPPLVYGWARRETTERFDVDIVSVGNDNFIASITMTNGQSWGSGMNLYWTASELANDKHTLLGDTSYTGTVLMGQPVAAFAPTLTETSANVYDVFGRDVYTSQLYEMLSLNTQFPTYETTASSMPIEVNIRCDTFYIDGSVEPFYGVKKVTVHARKILSGGSNLDFRAAQRCSSEFGCDEPPQATTDSNGKSNDRAIAGTDLEIYVYDVEGDVFMSFEGSNSTTPQEGGDGMSGANGADASKVDCDYECNKDCGGLFDGDWFLTGNQGADGQNGHDGFKGGDSMLAGGDAGDVLLYTQQLSGYVSLDKHPGIAGHPVAHGHGGPGGVGGHGSCGCSCNVFLWCHVIVICIPTCKVKDGNYCATSGANGADGTDGADGFALYGIPTMARQGSVGSTDLTTVSSVKQWFVGDTELLRMIEREGEMLFQRNDNADAKPIFDFILDVADETSLIYKQASELSAYIDQGYDYYGNSGNYAPDRNWADLDVRAHDLLVVGQSLQDAYNTVFSTMEDDLQSITTISGVVNTAVEANDAMFAFEEQELKDKKQLYLKSLKQIEATMGAEMIVIRAMAHVVFFAEEAKEFISDLMGGIVGAAINIISLNPQAAFDNTLLLSRRMRQEDCKMPTINKLEESLYTNLVFAFDYEAIKPENLDYTTMDTSAVPAIMLSDLAKNKGELVQELRCLFQDPDSVLAMTLERLIDNYFRDGAFRITLIDELMNMDAQLKQIDYNREVLADVQASTNEALNAAENSIQMQTRSSLSDLLLNLYQQQENIVMEYTYELSKAYEFESLWDFDALGKFSVSFSDKNVVLNSGSLNGMTQLNMIYQQLQTQRDIFLDYVAAYAGPASHIFTGYWEFNNDTYPAVISELQTNGQTTITLDIDPNDPATTRCENCYNGRLIGLYFEVIGDEQTADVPPVTYVMVSHQGDSRFMMPLSSGNDSVATFQQTPESDESGKLMSFDSSQLVSSIYDQELQDKFSDAQYQYCNGDGTDFSGTKPCKSPYSTYVITLPKSDNYVCPSNPNESLSGVNCQDFDFAKLKEIRVYAKISSWSNYPPDPSAASRLVSEFKQSH